MKDDKKKQSRRSWQEAFRSGFNKSSKKKEKKRTQDLYLKKLKSKY